MKYTLKKPLEVGSETITELVFREEVVTGDLRGLKFSSLADMSTDDLIKISSRLCGRHEVEFSKLSLQDFVAISEVVSGFLSSGLVIGTSA